MKKLYLRFLKGIYITICFLPFMVIGVITVFTILYIVKSILGIDLIPEEHLWFFP